MKLFVLFQPGGYCDDARIVGVFDSFDKALAEKGLLDNYGSEIKEMELNVGEKIRWIDVEARPPMDKDTEMVMRGIVKSIAETNPYANLIK